MIKKLSNQTLIENYNAVTSALLEENHIDTNNFNKLFPDVTGNYKFIAYKTIIPSLKKLNKTSEFVKFLNKHKNDSICIVGDYDCDGIMATVIMYITLQSLGINVSFITPNRLDDGYGLSIDLIDKVIASGNNVIITVDNGISAKKEVEYALNNGLDVLITDHHLPTEGLIPENVTIIDPYYNNDAFPGICGAFVAFKLCYEYINTRCSSLIGDYMIDELATFAAIATVTDMMPDLEENRLLLRSAFNYIDFIKSKNVWNRVTKLIAGAGGNYFLKDTSTVCDESLFGFTIGPLINAVSRMYGDPTDLIRNIIDCSKYGVFIDSKYFYTNMERKDHTRELVKDHVKTDDPINIEVLDESKYSFPISGLLGLMANRICDEENKPSLIGVIKDGLYEFSARSIPTYSIHDGFERIKAAHPELDLTGGGHASAMGMRLPATEENLKVLKEEFNKDFTENNKEGSEKVYYEYEPEFLSDIVACYNTFRTFGVGFKPLVFTYTGVLKTYDTESKIAIIGDELFMAFFKDEFVKRYSGQSISVNFQVKIDSNGNPVFKLIHSNDI